MLVCNASSFGAALHVDRVIHPTVLIGVNVLCIACVYSAAGFHLTIYLYDTDKINEDKISRGLYSILSEVSLLCHSHSICVTETGDSLLCARVYVK